MTENDSAEVRAGISKKVNKELGLPPRYRKLALDNFAASGDEVKTALGAMSRSAGVFLSGPCGTGKTHLAVGLLLHWYAGVLLQAGPSWLVSNRPKGKFVSAADLVIELADQGRRSESKFLRCYDEFDCLVLDDLGAEISTERSRHVFGALIDRRYRRVRRTIITSNLSLQDLGNLYDDRMASRIRGMCYTINLEGEDRRIGPLASDQSAAGNE
jgi:DNA replication protein DnaC